MGNLAIFMGAVAAAALAGLAAGWYLSRRRQKQRIDQRVALALSLVENRHKRELNHWQAVLAEQAKQLKEARLKARAPAAHAEQPERSRHP